MTDKFRRIVPVLLLVAAIGAVILLPASLYAENLRFVFMADSRGDYGTPIINTAVLDAINTKILALSPRPSFLVYGGDQAYFRSVSPRTLAERNAEAIAKGSLVRIVIGGQDETFENNCAFHEHLERLRIPHGWTVLRGVAHDPLGVLSALGDDNWAFYRAAFGAVDAPASKDEADADDAAASDADQDGSGAEDEPDALLTESGNILLDAIQLNQRIATSN